MSRRIVITIIGIVVVLVAGVVGYVLFVAPAGDAPQDTPGIPERTFDPFGGGDAVGDGGTLSDEGIQADDAVFFLSQLRQLTSRPVAGVSFAKRDDETVARFIERETGHLFDTALAGDRPTRITNTTIPAVQEARFADEGHIVFLRYLESDGETIQTFTGRIPDDQGVLALEGDFLPENISAGAPSPNGATVIYQQRDSDAIVFAKRDGSSPRALLSSTFANWQFDWIDNSTILLTTGAASAVPGLSQTLTTGGQTRILRTGTAGLTALSSPDETRLLYSQTQNGEPRLFALNRATGKVIDFGFAGLPEKCVWSTREATIVYCALPNTLPQNLPEVWYQGLVSLSDSIWKIDVRTGAADFLSALSESAGGEIDVIGPTLTDDETHLLFINKRDLTPWLLLLEK